MARISKRAVDLLAPGQQEYFVWDDDLIGFGVRVQPSGAKSFVVKYRAGRGRAAPTRRMTLGPTSRLSSEAARAEAKRLISRATLGEDPATDSTRDRQYPSVTELADRFIAEHLKPKRKASTAAWAQDVFDRIIKPELGRTRADLVKYEAVAALHGKWRHTPFQANRAIALISSMFAFAERLGLVPTGHNPAKHVQKYRESARERFLTTDELKRLGSAIREASTVGIEWPPADDSKPNSKHVPKDPAKRRTWLSPHAAAALKLLLLTGARVGEILNLRWEDVDFEREIAFLPDSKTGRKPLLLNSAAMQILSSLPRHGRFVVAGEHLDKPRHDLKRPFALVCRRASLDGVRIHDLRHTFASFGAGGGYGLPIIGKLLGHTQASTTNRYAHLHMDPVRRAADGISVTIAAALDGES